MILLKNDFIEIPLSKDYPSIEYAAYDNYISKNIFKKVYKDKNILINDQFLRKSIPIKKNNILKFKVYREDDDIKGVRIPIKILYEDDFLLILDKDKGLQTHPSRGNKDHSLANAIRYYFDSIGLEQKVRFINRLDKDTSGLILVAKNQFADGLISRLIKEGSLERKYILSCQGIIEKDAGIIDRPILKKDGDMKRIIDERGDRAITSYRVIERGSDTSRVEAKLLTGRGHQIRVHFQSIGHPLIGDPLYNDSYQEGDGPLRLDSYYLEFYYPIRGEKIRIIKEV